MSFCRFHSSVAFALALAGLLPVVGCAEPTEGGDDVETATQVQAIGAGDVVGGVRAAMEAVSMMKTYQKYGVAKITTDMIFDKINAMQADVTALKDSVNEIQAAVAATHKDVLNLPALSKTNEIYALVDGYRTASASSDPTAKAKFLDALAKNQAPQGSLRWADLATLNDLIVGKNGSSSLLTLVMQSAASKGVAEVGNDPVGRFMIEKRLVQEEAFFLLSEATKNDPSVNLAAQKEAHEARMAEQDVAFGKATDAYNALLLDAVGNARHANVQDCFYDDDYIFGIMKWPDSGLYSFNDFDPSFKTDPLNPWLGKGLHGPDFSIQGRQACNEFRAAHIGRVVAKARAIQMRNLWTSEEVFRTQSADQPVIAIESASYGSLNSVTGFVGFACQGKKTCSYKVDSKVLGDFEVNVQKDFVVRYSCGSGSAVKQVSLPKEADGSTALLSCQ